MSKVIKTVAKIATVAIAIAAAIPSGGTSLLALGAAALGTTAAVLSAGALALSLGSSLLFRPKAPATSSAAVDRLTANIDPNTPRKFVFGRTAFATDIRDQEYSGNQDYLHRFIVCASHRTNSVDELWLDDKLAWSASGGVTAEYAGYLDLDICLDGSAAEAVNIGPRMGASRRYTGLTYLYLRFKLTGNSKKASSPFAQSIPSRLTIVGNGALTYDPRLDSTVPGGSGSMRANDQTTWAWNGNASRNPALQMLWYLLGWRIQNPATGQWKLAVGKGIPPARIDLASFITAANLCDEPVALISGGTQPRYRSDGLFSEGDATSTVLDQLKAAMNAELDDVDGKIRITVLHNDLATPIASFSEDDIISGFNWDQTAPLDQMFNVVRGTFIDPSANSLFQAVDYPEVRIASMDGIDRIETVNFQTVQDGRQAQRLVKQRVARMLYSGRFTATFSYRAWKVQKNDVIRLTFAPLGWTDKLFRVIETGVQVDGQVPMTLQVEHPDIYLWDRDERPAIQAVDPTSYDPYLNPIYQDVSDPKYENGDSINDLKPAEPGATHGATPEQAAKIDLLDEEITAAKAQIEDILENGVEPPDLTELNASVDALEGDVAALQASVGDVGTTVASLVTTVGGHGTAITINATAITGLNSDLASLTNTVTSIGGSVTTLQSSFTSLNGTVSTLSSIVSAQGASITLLQTATSTAAGQIASLTTELRAGSNPNLIPNPGFENGFALWEAAGAGWGFGSGAWGQIAYNNNWSGAAGQNHRYVTATRVDVYASNPYTLSGETDMYMGAGSAGALAYLEINWYTQADAFIIQNGGPVQVAPHGFTLDGTRRTAMKVTATAPSNAAYARVRAVGYAPDGCFVSNFAMRQLKFELGSIATPYSFEASVVQTYTAISTANGAIATLSSTVSTQGASIIATSTAITTLQGTSANHETRIASTESSVSTNTTAITTANGKIATLTTQVTAGSPNLLRNGGFELGNMNYWTVSGVPAFNVVSGPDVWGSYASHGTNIANGGYCFIDSNSIAIEIDWHTLTADVGYFLNGGSGIAYLAVIWLNSSGVVISSVGGASRSASFNFSSDGYTRRLLQVTAYPPAGTARAYARVVWYKASGTVQSMHVRQVKFERGQVATPYSAEATIVTSYQALNTLTTQYASLSSTVSTLNSSVSVQQTAITTLQGRSAAFFQVEAVAGGRAQLRVYADANGGAGVDIVGDLNIDGDLIVSGTVSTPKLAYNSAYRSRGWSNSDFVPPPPGVGISYLAHNTEYLVCGGTFTKDVTESELIVSADCTIWSENDISAYLFLRIRPSGGSWTNLIPNSAYPSAYASVGWANIDMGAKQSDWAVLLVSDATADSIIDASREVSIEPGSLSAGNYEVAFFIKKYMAGSINGDMLVIPGASMRVEELKR